VERVSVSTSDGSCCCSKRLGWFVMVSVLLRAGRMAGAAY
jgi:hypothetical protein